MKKSLMMASSIVLVGALVAGAYTWHVLAEPEYVGMSAVLEERVGKDLREARITNWEYTFCDKAHVIANGMSYELPWTETSECSFRDRRILKFRVTLGTDGKYHFASRSIRPEEDDFGAMAVATLARTRAMLASLAKHRVDTEGEESKRIRRAQSERDWKAVPVKE